MKRNISTKFVVAALTLASMAVLTACGGGNSGESQPSASSSQVRVYGDSLADSGTFGFKATVQVADNYIFPERIAMQFGKTLCPYYMPTSSTLDSFGPNTAKTGCTNYAIAGGVINPATLTKPTTNQKGIMWQLADGAANAIGATDLIIIDGGGNDAANLIGAFLATQLSPGAASNGAWVGLLNSISPAAAASAADPTAAGTTYMKALADVFYASITANVLNKGGNRVVFANIPDVTLTPRFQAVLAQITALKGAAVAQQLQGLFQGWVSAFNAEFSAKASGETRVAVVDIYSNFQDEVANPSVYSLTNVKDPSCPSNGTDSSGLKTYSFPDCTATAVNAGYKSYLFADSFHPTPYGHQLASQLISRTLAQKGWL